ncbi:MAG: hypothetical protein Q4C98_11660, partial [Capnocytophaga sp.]|nr:hypothetical protein [Capnocytophaga sp.]
QTKNIKYGGRIKNVTKETGDVLIDSKLVSEMKKAGTKFTERNLKFVVKNSEGKIIFLEKGNINSGLEHIMEGKWSNKTNFQKLFNNSVDEMINNIYKAIKNEKYIKKIIDDKNRISYIYKIKTTQGLREFKIATGSNGYIVSFIPNW